MQLSVSLILPGQNLQAVAVAQLPLPPPPQNQEEPATPNPGQNASGEVVTLAFCYGYCDQQYHLFGRKRMLYSA